MKTFSNQKNSWDVVLFIMTKKLDNRYFRVYADYVYDELDERETTCARLHIRRVEFAFLIIKFFSYQRDVNDSLPTKTFRLE